MFAQLKDIEMSGQSDGLHLSKCVACLVPNAKMSVTQNKKISYKNKSDYFIYFKGKNYLDEVLA